MPPFPLFVADIELKDNKFAYKVDPYECTNFCLDVFDKGLQIVSSINQLEGKILKTLFRTAKHAVLKAP